MPKKLLKCMEFPRCFRKVSWVPQGDFKGVSRVFHRLKPFKQVSRGVSRIFHRSFKKIFKVFNRAYVWGFQGCSVFKNILLISYEFSASIISVH